MISPEAKQSGPCLGQSGRIQLRLIDTLMFCPLGFGSNLVYMRRGTLIDNTDWQKPHDKFIIPIIKRRMKLVIYFQTLKVPQPVKFGNE